MDRLQGLFDNAGRRRLLKGLGDKLARHARCFRQVYRSIGRMSRKDYSLCSKERTTMTLAIKVSGLVKHYESLVAVNNISFNVKEGEIFGLGPNGAGKTTTIRMLTGLSRPTAGTIELLGLNINSDVKAKAS